MSDKKSVKLCKLVKKEFLKINLKEYAALVKNPCFVCIKCGRVAMDKKNLCNPVELE